jgi:hypothetical protein
MPPSIAILSTSLIFYLLPKGISQHLNMGDTEELEFKYETYPGIFLQGDEATDWASFDYVLPPYSSTAMNQKT